jgi:hypothetical protein
MLDAALVLRAFDPAVTSGWCGGERDSPIGCCSRQWRTCPILRQPAAALDTRRRKRTQQALPIQTINAAIRDLAHALSFEHAQALLIL